MPQAVPVQGILPLPGDLVTEIELPSEGKAVFGFASRDIRSRGFNLMRGQVAKLLLTQGHRLIGVTSATPRVGKSFVAANLAAALSRSSDRHVYLIDLDLRRSSVAENFGLHGEQGVTEYLAGTLPSLVPVAVRVAGHALTIIPSFSQKVASADLLESEPMHRLVAALRALPENAIVICDMPPTFANDDAVIIARQLDGYLLVIEEGVTTQKQVRDSVDLLAPALCLGSVLNRYGGGFLNDDYGYGYASGAYSEYYG